MTLPLKSRPRIVIEPEREPVGVTEAAQTALNAFLMHEMAGTGMGFSEFILQTRRLLRQVPAGNRPKPVHHGFLKETHSINVAPSAKAALADIGRYGGTTRSDSILWAIALWREVGI